MDRINWHKTELNTPVPGMATETAAIANGPVKWGTSSVGNFVISCDSGLPEDSCAPGAITPSSCTRATAECRWPSG